MQGSEKAKRGRSKEKRTDCKLIGLSLAIGAFGFVRHCKIYRDNISEPGTLEGVVDDLKSSLSFKPDKPVVIMDAGISTEDNIELDPTSMLNSEEQIAKALWPCVASFLPAVANLPTQKIKEKSWNFAENGLRQFSNQRIAG